MSSVLAQPTCHYLNPKEAPGGHSNQRRSRHTVMSHTQTYVLEPGDNINMGGIRRLNVLRDIEDMTKDEPTRTVLETMRNARRKGPCS